MNVGMLWFDNDPKSDLAAKVSRAAAYYQNKYGQSPNLCLVHPTMIPSEPARAGSVEVRSSRWVMPHHFWIGQNSPQA